MEVAAVGIEGGAALSEPAHDHRRHVGQGQREDQQRQQQAHASEPLGGAHDADRGQGEAEEIGAPVAHEDAGGVEVVAQEAEAGAGKGCGQQSGGGLGEAEAHREQTDRGDAAHPSRQAIEAVEPVDRVGDAHQPHHGGQQAQARRQGEQRRQGLVKAMERFEGQLNDADPHPLIPHGHRHRHLAHQAGQGRQGEEVIGQADHEEAEGTGQGGPDQPVLVGGQVGEAAGQPGEGEGQAEAGHDADPAESHHGRGVLLAGIGGIHQVVTQAQGAHQGNHECGHQSSHHEGDQGRRVGAVGEGHNGRPGCSGPLGLTLRIRARIKRAGADVPGHRAGSGGRGRPPVRGSGVRWRCPQD